MIENAIQSLWSLTAEDENIDIMREENVVGMIVAAVKRHMASPKVGV